MLLKEKFTRLGAFFFKYRSYIPIPFTLVILVFLVGEHFRDYSRYGIGYELICFGVAIVGLTVRVLTIGYSRGRTSGRNTRTQLADSMNTDGLYSIVRNPLYLGNYLNLLGISMLFPYYQVIAINTLLFIFIYVAIIFQEEEFLLGKFQDAYREYSRRTPAIFPNPLLWKRPALKFNFIRVLYREYNTFMGTITGFAMIEAIHDLVVLRKITFDIPWTPVFIAGLIIWLIIRSQKRRLKALDTAP
jgi:protein-S-isoprenylcysteine O-methyltransferase Ste14